MDFNLSAEDEAFRAEVRSFVHENWVPKGFDAHSINVRSYDFDNAESRAHDHEFTRRLVDKGWYTMHWPRRSSGRPRRDAYKVS